jgi:hypothetical protein
VQSGDADDMRGLKIRILRSLDIFRNEKYEFPPKGRKFPVKKKLDSKTPAIPSRKAG